MSEHTNHIESAAVFADLCDYTRLTEQLGDGAAADMAVALGDIATTVARRHNGRVVKMLGDGAHLHFSGPADAVAPFVAANSEPAGRLELPTGGLRNHHTPYQLVPPRFTGAFQSRLCGEMPNDPLPRKTIWFVSASSGARTRDVAADRGKARALSY